MTLIHSAYKPLVITATATPCVRREDFARSVPAGMKLLDVINEQIANKKAALAKMLQVFKSGNLTKSFIEESDDSIKVRDWQFIDLITWDYNPEHLLRDKARLHVIADLTALGFEVGFVSHNPQFYEMLNDDVLAAAQCAGVKEENLALINRTNPLVEDVVLSFPRDIIAQLGNYFYLSPDLQDHDLGKINNWARGFSLGYDSVACGGAVVIAGNERFAFVSEPVHQASQYRAGSPTFQAVKCEEASLQRVKELMRRNDIKLYFLPPFWMDILPPSIYREMNFEKKVLTPSVHIDLAVLYLQAERALFFGEHYYQENKDRLDQVADEIQPKVFDTLPDEDGLPINSLPLPGGGVYMDSCAQQAISKIRRHGIGVSETSLPVGTWGWGVGGGLHCATNIINILEANAPSDFRM